MLFPIGVDGERKVWHIVLPAQAAHIIGMEWAKANPNQPCTVGWLLTDKEKEAGKEGIEWPTS